MMIYETRSYTKVYTAFSMTVRIMMGFADGYIVWTEAIWAQPIITMLFAIAIPFCQVRLGSPPYLLYFMLVPEQDPSLRSD